MLGRLNKLTLPQVLDFLLKQMDGPVERVQPDGHGEWSKAFTFACGDVCYVARFSSLIEHFLKDQRVMAYGSAALPVPQILQVGEAFGGFFAISKEMAGSFLDVLDGESLIRTLPSLFRVLDAARAVDLDDTTGFGVWNADGNAKHATWQAALLDIGQDRPDKRIHGWRSGLAARPQAESVFERALTEMRSYLVFCPEERHLVHSDLLNFNVLVDDDRVTGVIDWGSSLYGDFVWDIAWLCFLQPWHPLWSKADLLALASTHFQQTGLHVPHLRERVYCYQLAIAAGEMTYQVFAGLWTLLEQTARRATDLLLTNPY